MVRMFDNIPDLGTDFAAGPRRLSAREDLVKIGGGVAIDTRAQLNKSHSEADVLQASWM